jgi:hypothetical protein
MPLFLLINVSHVKFALSSLTEASALSQRTDTVTALYEKLKAYHLVVVLS